MSSEYGNPSANEAHVRGVEHVTWLGMSLNLALCLVKLLAAHFGRSKALLADAIHSLADLLSGVVLLVGVRYWADSADEQHPHGHRRIETLATIFIGGIVALIGAGICYDAIKTLPERHDPPNWFAFGAALISIAVKEGLYLRSVAVGRRINSRAVRAHALEHRSDALSSVPTAIAVLFAILLGPDWSFIDHIGAVLVSFFILWYAWRVIWPAGVELVDTGVSPEVREEIARLAMATAGVRYVHALRTRFSGPGICVDLHVKVDGGMSVRDGHDISEAVKRRLMDGHPEIVDVVVHIEPYENRDSNGRLRHASISANSVLESRNAAPR